MMNKRGQNLGTGISWLPAFFIIFFLSIIFLAITGSVKASKSLEDPSSLLDKKDFVGISEKDYFGLDANNALNQFLNTKVFFDSKEYALKDLLVSSVYSQDKRKSDFVKTEIREFLEDYQNVHGGSKLATWMRLQSASIENLLIEDEKYSDYAVSNEAGFYGCGQDDSDRVSYLYLTNEIKVVVCFGGDNE